MSRNFALKVLLVYFISSNLTLLSDIVIIRVE